MRISARNQIKGTVKAVQEGAVNAVVTISFGDQSVIKELGLVEGKECHAVIKATNVMFATERLPQLSARNQIEGTIVKAQLGAVNASVALEDADGNRLTGSITNEAVKQLGLTEGMKAVAIIKATDVLVAVD